VFAGPGDRRRRDDGGGRRLVFVWAQGINVSGTVQQYDQSSNVTGGTVAVAVNGVKQVGKTATISGSGTFTIANVTVFQDDIVTVFVDGAAEANEAVGITKYDGNGDITGMNLYEHHLSLSIRG
jgi:hypothetical protein